MTCFSRMKPAVATAVVLVSLLASSSAQASHRTQGVDVSQFQGTMNWNMTYDRGARFAFVRATRGGTSGGDWGSASLDDSAFNTNVLALRNLAVNNNKTIYNGFYHYSRPDLITVNDGNNSSGFNRTNSQPSMSTILANATDEAQHFYGVVGSHYTSNGTDAARRLRPVLDVEEGGGTDGEDPGADALTPGNLSLWVDTFCDTFQNLTGGVRPLLYMNTNYATNRVTTSSNAEELWLARYNSSTVNPETSDPATPSGFPNPYGVWNVPVGSTTPSHTSWSYWQYTNQGTGADWGASSTFIDLDLANGDLAFVQSFLIPEPITAPLLAGFVLLLGRRRRIAP